MPYSAGHCMPPKLCDAGAVGVCLCLWVENEQGTRLLDGETWTTFEGVACTDEALQPLIARWVLRKWPAAAALGDVQVDTLANAENP